MPKPLSIEENMKLTTAVETLNAVLRELHLAGHDYGVAVIGREPIDAALAPTAVLGPRHLHMNPPRIFVKLVVEAVEVGREPSR